MDVFCIGLVFSRDQYRYQGYARLYVEALLRLQKQVAIFSPNWIELNNYLQIHYRDQSKRIHCFPIEETERNGKVEGKLGYILRILKLKRRLRMAERSMQAKVDLVYFAPVDDWIRPKFGKNLFDKIFGYSWSGLITQMEFYKPGGLKLNQDPKYGEPDYLFLSNNCVGVCTLDRFRSEALKSRVYKKVVVMPDISELNLPTTRQKVVEQIKRMAKGRMVVGTILLENENPESFLNLANEAPWDQYFFVCAGRLDAEVLSGQSKEFLSRLLSSGKDNNYFILHSLDESDSINDLLLSFDVCYLNDGNFGMPHPLLTKAAFFNKPVLGSKNDMIGEILDAFKTGISVNGDVLESIQALNALRLQMPFERNFDLGKLRNYAQLQNQECLRDAWESLLLF